LIGLFQGWSKSGEECTMTEKLSYQILDLLAGLEYCCLCTVIFGKRDILVSQEISSQTWTEDGAGSDG